MGIGIAGDGRIGLVGGNLSFQQRGYGTLDRVRFRRALGSAGIGQPIDASALAPCRGQQRSSFCDTCRIHGVSP